MVPRGSALHMHHLSVVVVEFADTDTAQKIIGLIPITNLFISASLCDIKGCHLSYCKLLSVVKDWFPFVYAR